MVMGIQLLSLLCLLFLITCFIVCFLLEYPLFPMITPLFPTDSRQHQQTPHQCFFNNTIPLATSPTTIATFPSRHAFCSHVSVPFFLSTHTSLRPTSLPPLRKHRTIEEHGEQLVLRVATRHQRLLQSPRRRELPHPLLQRRLLPQLPLIFPPKPTSRRTSRFVSTNITLLPSGKISTIFSIHRIDSGFVTEYAKQNRSQQSPYFLTASSIFPSATSVTHKIPSIPCSRRIVATLVSYPRVATWRFIGAFPIILRTNALYSSPIPTTPTFPTPDPPSRNTCTTSQCQTPNSRQSSSFARAAATKSSMDSFQPN